MVEDDYLGVLSLFWPASVSAAAQDHLHLAAELGTAHLRRATKRRGREASPDGRDLCAYTVEESPGLMRENISSQTFGAITHPAHSSPLQHHLASVKRASEAA